MATSNEKLKAYLAAPFGTPGSIRRENAMRAKEALEKNGYDVCAPWEYKIPHDWDYPNHEWGLMVFTNDVYAIDHSDMVVVLSYGREDTTSGTNWEAGYAFGVGKKVIVVECGDSAVMSLMVSNGCYSRIASLDDFCQIIDFDIKYRTYTEQK